MRKDDEGAHEFVSKMLDDVCKVLPTIECLIEPKVKDSLQDFPLELSPFHDIEVCVTLVPKLALVSKSVLPKVGKDLMGQLEDPLGIVFTRASLG